MFVISFLSQSLPQNARLLLFKICVRPIAEYGSFLSSILRKSDCLAIERVQRRFTRNLKSWTGDPSYMERCSSLGLDPLWLRRIKSTLCFLHRLVHYPVPPIVTFAQTDVSNRLRNQRLKIKPPIARSHLCHNFFLYKYHLIWNELPEHIRCERSPIKFKRYINFILTPIHLSFLVRCNSRLADIFAEGIGKF